MHFRTSMLLVLAVLAAFAGAARAAPEPSLEDIALGWKFSDCSVYYYVMIEANKSDRKYVEESQRHMKASMLAATALLGAERVKVEGPAKRNEFLLKLTSGGADILENSESQCIELHKTSQQAVLRRLEALGTSKAAEQAK